MWLASAAVPALAFTLPGRLGIATALGAAGIGFAGAGVVAFRRAKTTVNPTKPGTASTVVTAGVYSFSRNPMYLGLLLALSGWAVFLNHALAFVFLPVFVLYMNRFQIGPEEKALLGVFGEEYAAYLKSVRRWL